MVRLIAEQQHALVSHQQAVDVGFTDSAIRYRVEMGLWQRLLPRVYLVRGAPRTGRQAAMAATLWAGDGVVSHLTAAVLWELDGVETTRVEVTVPYHCGRRHTALIVHRTQSLAAVDRSALHGIPVTSPARTLIDIAAVVKGEDLETALESALRRRLTTQAFVEWRLRELSGAGRRGAQDLRTLLQERGRGAAALEYRLEVKLSRLFAASDLPPPVRQHWVFVDDLRFRLDFSWPDHRVALEADGYSAHGGRVAFVRDRRRLRALGAAGWRVLPVTWDQVTRRPEAVIDDVRRALGFIEG